MTDKFDYMRDMWQPATRETYAKGGHYLLQELTDAGWVDVRPLSLEEALTFKMTKTQALLHVYPEKDKE